MAKQLEEVKRDTKSFLTSKTIQGAVVTALAGAFPALGIVPESLLFQAINTAFLLGGLIYTIYGRIKAKKAIG